MDVQKAIADLRSPGVAFEKAIKAFKDPFAIEQVDGREDYGEIRINLLG